MLPFITGDSLCLIIAVVLFGIAGFIRLNKDAYAESCIAFGFALVVLSFLVTKDVVIR